MWRKYGQHPKICPFFRQENMKATRRGLHGSVADPVHRRLQTMAELGTCSIYLLIFSSETISCGSLTRQSNGT